MIHKPKFNLKDTVYIDRKFSSLSSSFFKPIVATSLLFLLPSLGMATDVTSTDCADKGTCSALNLENKNLTLKMSSSSGSGTYIAYDNDTTNTLTITFYSGLATASFKDSYFSDTSGKGFDLGTGTFTIDFGTQSATKTLTVEATTIKTNGGFIIAGKDNSNDSANLTANVNLSGDLLASSITIKGNGTHTIKLTSGNIASYTGTSTNSSIVFQTVRGNGPVLNLDFSENNGGNIYANVAGTDAYGTINITGYEYSDSNTTVTPTTTLYGNFYTKGDNAGNIGNPSAKSITLNFKGAKMEGNISTVANDYLTKNVIFEGTHGSDVVLTGDIKSVGVGAVAEINKININKGIHAIFKTGSMTGDITTINSKGRRGYVSAIFLGTDQKLDGSITASASLADLTVGDNASLTVTGSITSSSGQESVTRVFVGSGASLKVDGSITSGQTSGNAVSNSNLVVLDSKASLTVNTLSTTRSGVQVPNENYNNIVISFNSSLDTSKFTDISTYASNSAPTTAASSVNSLTVGSISAKYGNIYIGGANLITLDSTSSSGSGTAKSLSDTSKYVVNNAGNLTWTDSTNMASNTFSGKMSLGDITAGARGTTYIAFKATSDQTSSVITGTISNVDATGTNNIYLDLSGTTSLAASQITSTAYSNLKAGIVGDISTDKGTNNIVLKGSTTDTQLGLAGNITNSSGTTNIVFDDTIWAPSYILNGTTSTTVGGTSSGSVSNTGNGTINLVFRQSGSQALSGTSMFNVTNSGSKGTTNIVFKSTTTSTLNVGANVNYSSGSVNILVASGTDSSDSSTIKDDFSSSADITNNKILGVTYKDGIKFTLKKDSKVFNDATSSVKGVNGSSDVSILTTGTTSSTSVQITGIYTGTVSLLGSSSANGSSGTAYTFTLTSGSIFAGSFEATSSSNSTDNLTLVMKSGSKVFNASSTLSLGNLKVENATIDTASYTNSVASSNTIIDAGTLGSNINDGFTSDSINNAFNLVTINSYSGNNAVFRVRVDGTASSATLGGKSSSDYGAIYADRFVVNAVTSSGSTTTSAYIQPIFTEETDISKITYSADNTNGNIAVFTVKNSTTSTNSNDSSSAGITLKALTGVQGYNLVSYTLTTAKTNEKGVVDSTDSNNTYTTYFLDSATYSGIAETDMTKSVRNSLALGYNLFLANFNSLNKRTSSTCTPL